MSLVENINKRRKEGKSRSKKNSTISSKAYKNMQQGWQKKASGGMAKSSAQTSVIKGASVGGSREGSTIPGPRAKGSREGSVIKAKDGKWIQKVNKSIEKRGTKGKCTPITKPGCTGRAKALAKTFKKMARERKSA